MSASLIKYIFLFVISLLIVSFGQPAWNGWIAPIAATIGYALFWKILLNVHVVKQRFFLGTIWFTIVQLIQLSWFIAHPFSYIYAVYVILSLLIGVQFGLLCIWVTSETLRQYKAMLALAASWVLLEWSRLLVFSGLPFNPVGLSLTGLQYPLQLASIGGIFLLSFWVILVNLFSLKVWYAFRRYFAIWIIVAVFPYIYGILHVEYHQQIQQRYSTVSEPFYAVLVQTAFPAEEAIPLLDRKHMLDYVMNEWHTILSLTKKQLGKSVDVIILPEMVVPYGTYSFVYLYDEVVSMFENVFGKNALKLIPESEEGALVSSKMTLHGKKYFVNNAFWTQSIANIFNSDVIIGLEDVEVFPDSRVEHYSGALYFKPQFDSELLLYPPVDRYEKRILLPMGEYIPFSFVKQLAAQYGVTGSFTHGSKAKIVGGRLPMGLSICYEEMFGHVMRENKQIGAKVLVNLTSDVWYPNSMLPQQHFDHARLRTVENGIPLLRACNTGVTAVVDSLGKTVSQIGVEGENSEWIADSLRVQVPTYTYATIYSHVGDYLIISLSIGLIIYYLIDRYKK